MLLRGSQHLLPNPGHLCAYSVSRALDSAAFMKVHVTGSYEGSHGRLVLREMVEQHGLPDATLLCTPGSISLQFCLKSRRSEAIVSSSPLTSACLAARKPGKRRPCRTSGRLW